jgi:hypothetical protein
MEEGAKDKIAERQRESVCERASIGRRRLKIVDSKIHMFDKQNGQHLGRLLLISKMGNLANDVSHDRSILTATIFGATTICLFLIKSIVFANEMFTYITIFYSLLVKCLSFR